MQTIHNSKIPMVNLEFCGVWELSFKARQAWVSRSLFKPWFFMSFQTGKGQILLLLRLKVLLFCGQFNLSQLHQHSSTSNQRCTSLEPTEIVWDCNLKWVEFSLFFPWIWSIGRSSLFVYLVLTAMQECCMINNQYPFVKILNIQCLFKTGYYIDTTFYFD